MKSNPATLIILTPGFPSDEQDTTCLPAQQVFVKALNRVFPELNVVLIALEYPHRKDSYYWFGNQVVALGGWKRSKWNKGMTLVRAWRALRKYEPIGILSWWCGPAALLGTWWARRAGVPHFTWILGQDARAGNQFVRFIRPGRDQLVAMSVFLAEEFNRNYKIRPLHVIPNGIDTTLFGIGGAVRDIDVIGVGNLTTLKRYDVFLSVVRRLPGVKGVICGKGEEFERLEGMIRELGLNVQLLGERPHRAVLEMMQRSKILLHTSSYEGFGTVLLEALYAGAHVISFVDMGGKPVENWHVVGSEAEMVAMAMRLLNDPETSYEPVLPHSMDDSARSMMALYGYGGVGREG